MHKYKQYRNKLNHLLRIGEKKYLKEQLWKHKSNMRKTWEIIENVINKSRNSTIKRIFHVNNVKTSDKIVISNGFNKYFVNVGATLANSIPRSDKSPMSYINQNIMDTFYTIPTTNKEMKKIIANFKDSAAGWDILKPCITTRKIRQFFATPLVHICNLSFIKGVFTNELKLAKIVPIFKQGNRELFQNYRRFLYCLVYQKFSNVWCMIDWCQFLINTGWFVNYSLVLEKEDQHSWP